MARLRRSALSGTLDADVTDSGTTLSSPGFADLPVVASPDHLALILDPGKANGEPEIVYVYAHSSTSTVVTATRGREQAHGAIAGRAHTSGTAWHHGPTPGEFIGDVDGGAHTVAATPITLNAPVVAVQVDADIEAFTDGEQAELTLILGQGSTGGVWTSHTGISVSWEAGAIPTLATTPGNYDVIRLIRVAAGVSTYIGRVEISNATIAPA